MFSEYEAFTLSKSLDDPTIPIGTRGVVLMVFPGKTHAYEVEFPDSKGGNLGQRVTYTVTEDYMEAIREGH